MTVHECPHCDCSECEMCGDHIKGDPYTTEIEWYKQAPIYSKKKAPGRVVSDRTLCSSCSMARWWTMTDIRTTEDITVGNHWTVRTARDGDQFEAAVVEYDENSRGTWVTRTADDAPRVTGETLYTTIGRAIDAFCEHTDERVRHVRSDASGGYRQGADE